MTKKLEELFDIASQEENELHEPVPGVAAEVTGDALSNLEKIENALPSVRGLEASDLELDGIIPLDSLNRTIVTIRPPKGQLLKDVIDDEDGDDAEGTEDSSEETSEE